MNKTYFQSDFYYNNQKSVDAVVPDPLPVGINATGVYNKTTKYGMDQECSEEIEANIQARFSLNSPDIKNPVNHDMGGYDTNVSTDEPNEGKNPY